MFCGGKDTIFLSYGVMELWRMRLFDEVGRGVGHGVLLFDVRWELLVKVRAFISHMSNTSHQGQELSLTPHF